MRIYLAARYSRNPEMRQIRDELVSMGHTVTSRWIEGEHTLEGADDENDLHTIQRARFALDDIIDLLNADCIICFTEEPRSTHARGGRHVEFGIALSMVLAGGEDKYRIVAVGWRENVFYCIPHVEFYPTWTLAKESL